jgi:tellurite resistance protein TerA
MVNVSAGPMDARRGELHSFATAAAPGGGGRGSARRPVRRPSRRGGDRNGTMTRRRVSGLPEKAQTGSVSADQARARAAAPSTKGAPAMTQPRPVILTKSAPTVSLAKHGVTSGLIRVNLNWTAPQAVAQKEARGLFGKMKASLQAATARDVDLDLGCLISFTDGEKAVVQALGNSFGSLEQPPYVHLDGDDRTGGLESGENLAINLNHQDRFEKLLLFVYIYEGSGDFRGLDAKVSLTSDKGDRFEVHLDDCPPKANACAIALIERQNGELVVGREVRWFVPQDGTGIQEVISKTYEFGIQWTPGRK